MRLDLDPSDQSLIRNGLSGRAAVRKLHLRMETRLKMPNYKRTGLKNEWQPVLWSDESNFVYNSY